MCRFSVGVASRTRVDNLSCGILVTCLNHPIRDLSIRRSCSTFRISQLLLRNVAANSSKKSFSLPLVLETMLFGHYAWETVDLNTNLVVLCCFGKTFASYSTSVASKPQDCHTKPALFYNYKQLYFIKWLNEMASVGTFELQNNSSRPDVQIAVWYMFL